MKKHLLILAGFAFVTLTGIAQEDKRIGITAFEDELEWSYSGGSILTSFVEYQPFLDETIAPKEGEASLYVEYDNAGNGWQWAQMNFQNGAIDATGMTELHMWVYFIPGSVANADGNYQVDIRFGEVNLGAQSTQVTGEWVELVWPIDSLTSSTRMSSVSFFGGFIAPGSETAKGSFYIDDIYFYRPAGVVETETILVYGFNEEDPETIYAVGWGTDDQALQAPLLGQGEVTPSEGSNYMEFPLGTGWVNVVHSTQALVDFDRWSEVQEIMVDVRLEKSLVGWGAQSALVLQSGGGWDQYAENSYSSAVDNWTTLVWKVNMSIHAESLSQEGAWLIIRFSTNNGTDDAGTLVFFDNFRVVLPKITNVMEWSLF